jgi:hypothetical protein
MANYDKKPPKIERLGVIKAMDRQYFNSISSANNPHYNEYTNNSFKKPVKQSSGVMRCSAEKRMLGYC